MIRLFVYKIEKNIPNLLTKYKLYLHAVYISALTHLDSINPYDDRHHYGLNNTHEQCPNTYILCWYIYVVIVFRRQLQ